MTWRHPAHRLLQALDHFNAAHPWDHNAHYHRWVLRQLPHRFGSALDVGSGSGDLARLLATRADEVHGVDADPVITSQARALTPEATAASFTVADALTGLPAGPHDVITCVATIHHLPFTEVLSTFRRHLAPGGTLVVVGLFRPRTALGPPPRRGRRPAERGHRVAQEQGRRAAPPTSMTARTRPADMPFSDITEAARTALPGARLRRRLFWRYTLTWSRP